MAYRCLNTYELDRGGAWTRVQQGDGSTVFTAGVNPTLTVWQVEDKGPVDLTVAAGNIVILYPDGRVHIQLT